MRGYRHNSTVRQMAVSVAVFAALALLLESGGVHDWARRLELGPERTVAVPLAGALHWALGWTRLETVRRRELTTLARVGWSDDAEAVAASRMDAGTVATSAAAGSAMTPAVQASEMKAAVVKDVAAKDAGAKPIHTPLLPLTPMAGDPPLVSELPRIPKVAAGKTRTVALVGDSMMAVGLSSAMLREAPKYPDLALVKAFKSGTGLARPEVYDWQTEYPEMLRAALPSGAKPETAVVAIGANDGQGFVEDGVTYAFGTREWRELYQRRVEAFLAMLERGGTRVVWVELPPMKNGTYDARIALVNKIDYAVVSASPNAVWFSTAGVVGDAQGRFQDFGMVHGATARLRQQDGIHLSDDGAALLSAKLLPWLAKQETAAVKETASVGGSPLIPR